MATTLSRLLKITVFYCRIQSLLVGSFAKETYHFKEPTNRSHPISAISIAHALFLRKTPVTWGMSPCATLQDSAVHCRTLQHAATTCSAKTKGVFQYVTLHDTTALCSTLQHTAAHCNTLQHTATHCNNMEPYDIGRFPICPTARHCSALQRTATQCSTLQQHETL